MQHRPLGKAGPSVSAVGLGCFPFTGGYGEVTEAQARRTIDRAVELGVTIFDTAESYGDGENEQFVGGVLRPIRDEVTIVTKFGSGGIEGKGSDAPPESIRGKCEDSLRRLGFEVIDVYLAHRIDRRYPIEETVGAMADLVRAGLVRTIGLPECRLETVLRAHSVWPLAAIEAEYSLSSRNIETAGLLDLLVELEIGLIAYSPLGRGMLARPLTTSDLSADDLRRRFPRFQGGNMERNGEVATRVGALATKRGCSPSQLLLAWILAKAPNIIPIPGCRTEDHLAANVGAANFDLEPDDVQLLESIISDETIVGERYPEGLLAHLGD